MNHTELTAFFLALGLLLLVARVLGELSRRMNMPSVLGELLAGVLLGPSVLGAISPTIYSGLFPTTPGFTIGLEAVTTLGIALFLMVAGIEVDLSAILRQGKSSFVISIFGMVIPFAIGFGSAMLVPTLFVAGASSNQMLIAFFLGTALSITALPVIAKILIDLNMYRSDLGMIIIAVAVINDIVGWLLFATILGTMSDQTHGMSIWWTISLTVGFTVLILTVGRVIIDTILPPLQAYTSWPGGVLSFAVSCGLLAAALTEWIGIHAILGTFMFGVAFGDSKHLRERTRQILDHFISFIFAPLFFASIGLQVDIVQYWDTTLVVIVLLIASIGKILGSLVASRMVGFNNRESLAIGFGMNARGGMIIILGLLALQAGLIGERLFVALIVMAIVTSLVAGPAMQWIMGQRKVSRLVDFLYAKAFVPQLRSHTREGVIAELAAVLAQATGLPHTEITGKVMEREKTMPTGIGRRAAIPHARIEGLTSPAIAVGYSKDGIDFDAPDGQPARLIFLVLTPKDEFQRQLQILAEIGRLLRSEQAVERILQAQSFVALRGLINSEEKAHVVRD